MAHSNPSRTARSPFVHLPATELTNALVAFLFAASAPVTIIMSAGAKGGLSQSDIASWIFAAFSINGILTVAMSAIYRQPLAFFWTIPGTVLVASALQHLTFAEVIGAYLITAILILALGLTGWVKLVMDRLPLPIIMGMVAGVFLNFGLDWIRSFASDPWLAAAMTVTFFVLSAFPAVQKRFPPMVGVLIVGIVSLVIAGEAPSIEGVTIANALAQPNLYVPAFSWPAILELVVPLTVTVVAVYTPQGVSLLRNAGHSPPVNAITNACGIFSAITALFGCVSTCLTGPSSAILASGGCRSRHWLAGIFLGILAILFGAFSPIVTQAMLATPTTFLASLAGLALLRILQGAFQTSFSQKFSLGALVAFLVTLGSPALFGIGAPFWGIVFGVVTSLMLERPDWTRS